MHSATVRHETKTAKVRRRTAALQDLMLTNANDRMIADFDHAPASSSGTGFGTGANIPIAEMVHCRPHSAGTSVKEN
jgi:hypothetical protein